VERDRPVNTWADARKNETMERERAIVAEELVKRYRGGVQALAGVSFTVRQGEIYGLLGPNGAGKSTTVRILATLTRPDSGRAIVAGHDVLREPGMVRRAIGYVAQASGVDRWATGRENLLLQGHLERMPGRELRQRVDELLEQLGLAEAADRLVNTYSGGMRRRLDIAMGLVHRPAVLFLDEPTTGLDPEARALLWADLQRLRAEGSVTVLLTTHYLEEADRLCDRLAIVDHGRVIVEGTPAGLKAELQGDRVTLEVEGDATRAARALDGLPGVLEAVPNGAEVIARVSEGATAIPLLVTALERAGVAVSAVTLSRPSLDDVYLHYTGHRYRGEGEFEEASLAAGAARRA
jgi:ABC-2 type transport system ATP-binding protein